MNKHLAFIIAAAVSVIFAGCLPESKYPLSTPADSRLDDRLEGVYIEEKKDAKESPAYWHFHYRGASSGPKGEARTTTWLEVLGVIHEKQGGLDATKYRALATRIGGNDYLSFVTLPAVEKTGAPLLYSFARYEVTWRGDLRIWVANEGAWGDGVKAGKLRGKVKSSQFGDDVLLTDTTANLAAFLAAGDPKKLFTEEPMRFRRIAH
jgi:hypothetical protein